MSEILLGFTDGPENVSKPFGSRFALGSGASISVQRITSKNFILGLALGYDNLKSKVVIDKENTFLAVTEINGYDFVNTKFINTNLFVGYRINLSKISVDLTAGMDCAKLLSAQENAFLIDKDLKEVAYTNTYLYTKPLEYDFRPRFQVTMNYNKFSADVSYAYGLSHYKRYENCYCDNPPEIKSRVIRFGVSYQIK